jgi:hypothetical protein
MFTLRLGATSDTGVVTLPNPALDNQPVLLPAFTP